MGDGNKQGGGGSEFRHVTSREQSSDYFPVSTHIGKGESYWKHAFQELQ